MNLLNEIFNPITTTDLFFVKFGIFVSLLFLLPYLSLLIGNLIFSLLHFSKFKIYRKKEYLVFSKYLIEISTKKFYVRFIFGILSFFSFALFYSQLYTSPELNASENLLFAFILFVAGLCLSVIYKNSFNTKVISEAMLNDTSNISEINKSNNKLLVRGGWLGLLLLFISSYTLISYVQLALSSALLNSESIYSIIFSIESFIYFLFFISLSFSITSAVVLARLNRTKENYEFSFYAKEFSTKTGILFSAILPIFFIIYVFSVSASSLSFGFFTTSLIVLILMLSISIQFYLNYKSNSLKSTRIALVFILLFTFLVYNIQITSERVSKKDSIKKGITIDIFS